MKFKSWQLRAARAASGMTIRELAAEAGVSTAMLSIWEGSDGWLETGESYREAGKLDAEKVDAVFTAIKARGVRVTIEGRTISLTA